MQPTPPARTNNQWIQLHNAPLWSSRFWTLHSCTKDAKEETGRRDETWCLQIPIRSFSSITTWEHQTPRFLAFNSPMFKMWSSHFCKAESAQSAFKKNSANNEAQCPPVTGVIVSQRWWGDSIATVIVSQQWDDCIATTFTRRAWVVHRSVRTEEGSVGMHSRR